jgi:alkylation response protein AidB-like acyl-CoA dehydrogenase
VKERHQFGRRLADNQAVKLRLADVATELEASQLLTLRAARMKEQGVPFSRAASMAKLFASESAWRACDAAVQLHGGYGYTRDFPVERYLRDVRVARIYEGTSEVQRIVIARSLLKEQAA